jgi:hypothetical protein
MVAAAALAVSACGSQSRVGVVQPPRLPRAVAMSLAGQSDALAAALRRGDGCAAKAQVHALEHQTRLAISAGRVPPPYRTRLLAAVSQIAARVPRCVPPLPPAPSQPEQHGKRKHDDHPKPPKPDKHYKGAGD